LAHSGIHATKCMVTACLVWNGVGKDMATLSCSSISLIYGKVHKQPAAPLHAIPIPACRFSYLHVDLMGPLPASSDGQVYLLTSIDRSTRWEETVQLRNMKASICKDSVNANTFWCASHCHNRQRQPIYLCMWTGYLHALGYQAGAHHCLPSSDQRDGRGRVQANH
jgi:hypothetical protein